MACFFIILFHLSELKDCHYVFVLKLLNCYKTIPLGTSHKCIISKISNFKGSLFDLDFKNGNDCHKNCANLSNFVNHNWGETSFKRWFDLSQAFWFYQKLGQRIGCRSKNRTFVPAWKKPWGISGWNKKWRRWPEFKTCSGFLEGENR